MKIPVGNMAIEISDWNPKFKKATLIVGISTILLYGLTLMTEMHLLGLATISLGVTVFLLSIKLLNMYFKEKPFRVFVVLGILGVVLYACLLYIGIHQIVSETNSIISTISYI